MYGFIQTGLLYHLSMLVFLTVVSCGIVFGGALALKWVIRFKHIEWVRGWFK